MVQNLCFQHAEMRLQNQKHLIMISKLVYNRTGGGDEKLIVKICTKSTSHQNAPAKLSSQYSKL